MSKRPAKQSSSGTYDTTRLVVWGERRLDPDWDSFVAILLAHALNKVGANLDDDIEEDDDA